MMNIYMNTKGLLIFSYNTIIRIHFATYLRFIYFDTNVRLSGSVYTGDHKQSFGESNFRNMQNIHPVYTDRYMRALYPNEGDAPGNFFPPRNKFIIIIFASVPTLLWRCRKRRKQCKKHHRLLEYI